MASALVGIDLCKGALSHRTVLLRGAGEVHDVERELERQRVRLGLLGQHDLHAQAELQRTAANKQTHAQTNKQSTHCDAAETAEAVASPLSAQWYAAARTHARGVQHSWSQALVAQ